MDIGKTALVRLIEELAMNAWPAETIQIVDGWRLRFNHGVSRRTNSAWPNEWGGSIPQALKLELVDDFYRRRELPARYQICPAAQPAGLDQVLEARGFKSVAPTLVQTASTENVLAAVSSRRTVEVVEGLQEEWFQAYSTFGSYSHYSAAIVRNSLARSGPRAAYALARQDSLAIAVGRGVLERGWLGIFAMATRPDQRRKGFGRDILHGLAAWAKQNGADSLYLQVEAHNLPAQALYQSAGFTKLYGYHYREGRG